MCDIFPSQFFVEGALIKATLKATTICALCLTLFVSALSGCAHHKKKHVQQPPGAFLDVSYVPGKKDLAHQLDVYVPERGKDKPALILFIHGGAWQVGDKRPAPYEACLKRGYALASINYRMTGEAKFPACIQDCKAALRFLRANADKFGFDANRVGVWGVSAGGHLAALMGTSNGVKDLEGDEGNLTFASNVQVVCDWCGPTDLVTFDKQCGPENKLRTAFKVPPLPALIGGEAKDKPVEAKAASPVTYVTADDPPFLIVQGDKDDLVPYQQAQELADILKKANVETEFVLLKNVGHTVSSDEEMERLFGFFDKHLKQPL